MPINISYHGLKEIGRKIGLVSDNAEKSITQEGQRIVEQIATDARFLCPVSDVDGGRLREGIQTRTIKDGNDINFECFNDVFYATYVELGTGLVGASAGLQREGLALAYTMHPWTYYNEKFEKWITTQGNEPQPFMYDAMKQNEDEIKDKLGSAVVMEFKK